MSPSQVAPGVWRAGTRYVNWYIVDAGADGLTLVDTGQPRYLADVERSLRQIGRCLGDVKAVVLTHGDVDHAGCADVVADAGAALLMHPADKALADNPSTNSTDRSLLRYLAYPATLAFVAHAIRNGATRSRPMPESTPLVDGQLADVPGRPLVRHTPGHTDGSCTLEFRDHETLFVGDLLCTADPFSGKRTRPQLQTRGSNRSSDQALTSLDRLHGVEARLVLPGHGDPWHDGVEAAVDSARRLGCR